LGLVIMSATIQLDVFARYFLPIQKDFDGEESDSIPTIKLQGKPFPIEILYVDDIADRKLVDSSLLDKFQSQFMQEMRKGAISVTPILNSLVVKRE